MASLLGLYIGFVSVYGQCSTLCGTDCSVAVPAQYNCDDFQGGCTEYGTLCDACDSVCGFPQIADTLFDNQCSAGPCPPPPTSQPTNAPYLPGSPSTAPTPNTGNPTAVPHICDAYTCGGSDCNQAPLEEHYCEYTDWFQTTLCTNQPDECSACCEAETIGQNQWPQLDQFSAFNEYCTTGRCPTLSPTLNPSSYPSKGPTDVPSTSPSKQPIPQPSQNPLDAGQTHTPSKSPTMYPTKYPTLYPSQTPSNNPTELPSLNPSIPPTNNPTDVPTQPSESPSDTPSQPPTAQPSRSPLCTDCTHPPSESMVTSSPPIPSMSSTSSVESETTADSGNSPSETTDSNAVTYVVVAVVVTVVLCIVLVIVYFFCKRNKNVTYDRTVSRADVM